MRPHRFDAIEYDFTALASSMTLDELIARLPEILTRDLDDNLCVCNCIPKRQIIQAMFEGAGSMAQIREACMAGDGTGCCKLQLKHLLDAIQKLTELKEDV